MVALDSDITPTVRDVWIAFTTDEGDSGIAENGQAVSDLASMQPILVIGDIPYTKNAIFHGPVTA